MTIDLLTRITRKAWAFPVLALIAGGTMPRLAPLAAKLEASRGGITQALLYLVELELLTPNPGHGHPLRPEFVLTEKGKEVGAQALTVWTRARNEALGELIPSRWVLPILHSLPEPKPYGALRRDLCPITDRALSLSLKKLVTIKSISRKVDGSTHPPTTLYVPLAPALQVATALRA